jgi:hypothetical protein
MSEDNEGEIWATVVETAEMDQVYVWKTLTGFDGADSPAVADSYGDRSSYFAQGFGVTAHPTGAIIATGGEYRDGAPSRYLVRGSSGGDFQNVWQEETGGGGDDLPLLWANAVDLDKGFWAAGSTIYTDLTTQGILVHLSCNAAEGDGDR